MITKFKEYLRSRSVQLGLLFFFLFALFPFFLGGYLLYVIKLALVLSIFAIAYDVFFGYTGMVSFGHSLFYGLSAYVMAISCAQMGVSNPFFLLALALVGGAILGVIIGYICTFTYGIYLALITFALAHMSWLVVMANPYGLTQGENGIAVTISKVGLGGVSLDLGSGAGLYFLIFGVFVVCFLITRFLMNSPFGDVLRGIRDNEERVKSLGYNVRQYKIVAFAFSGALSGLAGGLMGFLEFFVTPSFVNWIIGAEAILWTILGGPGTLIGPVLGAFTLTFSKSYLEGMIGGYWVIFYGSLFIAVVLLLPEGLISIFERIREYII